MTFAKIELTSPRLITRVKKNNGEWCPAIPGRHPLLNEVAVEAREEQLDCFCDDNGGAFEDAELRGLVRTIIYLESIKPTTCSIEQKIKREYDRELENTTVPANFCVGTDARLHPSPQHFGCNTHRVHTQGIAHTTPPPSPIPALCLRFVRLPVLCAVCCAVRCVLCLCQM